MAVRREQEGPKGEEAGWARRGPVQRASEVSGRSGRLPEGLSHSGGGARRIAAVLIPGRGAWTSHGSGAGDHTCGARLRLRSRGPLLKNY